MQLQWWCSAQTAAWEWTWRPYLGVWLFIALLALGYRSLLRRSARASPGGPAGGATRSVAGDGDRVVSGEVGRSAAGGARVAAFATGLACLWIALDWPVGALGGGYLASVHMIQFLLIAMIAPPLLLWGVPPAAYEALRGGGLVARAFGVATSPVVAIIAFNVLVGVTHVPAVTDTMMATQLGSFAIDVAWIAGGLLFWWPVAAPLPERPLFHDLVKLVYMTAQAIFMTPVFLFLTYSAHPVYATYELAPPVAGLDALADQKAAGLIMKVVGGFILMAAVTILFFRWARETGDDPAALEAAAAGSARGAAWHGRRGS